MMAAAATRGVDFEVKGWCPSALRPMPSGDGLIVRVRPHAACIALSAFDAIIEAAAAHGNGHIDLTRRSNLQIRGVGDAAFAPLLDRLRSLALIDGHDETDAAHNILVNPLAGLDPGEVLDLRGTAGELSALLARTPAARRLPAKFGFVLDGGGRCPISKIAADVHLAGVIVGDDRRVALGLGRADGTRWLGSVEGQIAARAAAEIAVAVASFAGSGTGPRVRDVGPEQMSAIEALIGARPIPHHELPPQCARAEPPGGTAVAAALGVIDLTHDRYAVGIGVPFGRLDTASARGLVAALREARVGEIRLSPWRAVYVPVADRTVADALMSTVAQLGFLTDADQPLARIDACPGRPACTAAHADTRRDALALAAWMARTGFAGAAHISGCSKGCARSAPADVTLVGEPGGYRVMRDARARDTGGSVIAATDLRAELDEIEATARDVRHD